MCCADRLNPPVNPVEKVEHSARQRNGRAYDLRLPRSLSRMRQERMNVLYSQIAPRTLFAIFDADYTDST
jgi:hypothetical protein